MVNVRQFCTSFYLPAPCTGLGASDVVTYPASLRSASRPNRSALRRPLCRRSCSSRFAPIPLRPAPAPTSAPGRSRSLVRYRVRRAPFVSSPLGRGACRCVRPRRTSLKARPLSAPAASPAVAFAPAPSPPSAPRPKARALSGRSAPRRKGAYAPLGLPPVRLRFAPPHRSLRSLRPLATLAAHSV